MTSSIKKYIKYENLIYVILILLVAAYTYQILIEVLFRNFHIISNHTKSILDGTCGGVNETWQNRLLSPYLIKLISFSGLSFVQSIKLFFLLTLIANAFAVVLLLHHYNDNKFYNVMLLVVYFFVFLLLQKRILMPFDPIDMLVFTFFVYGIAKNKGDLFFLILFSLSLINRESAIFIAVYFILDSIKFYKESNKNYVINYKKIITAFILILIAIFYIHSTRKYLYIDTIKCEDDYMFLGNFIYLADNLKAIFFENFLRPHQQLHTVLILFPFLYFALKLRFFSEKFVKCFLLMIIIFVNILIFALFIEKRVHLIFLPFFLVMFLELYKVKKISSNLE